MEQDEEKTSDLEALSAEDMAGMAMASVNEEIDDTGVRLLSRWEQLNRGMLRGFRTKTLAALVGASGSGKSHILGQMKTDFTDMEPLVISTDGLSKKLVEHLTTIGEFQDEGEILVRPPINVATTKPILLIHFGFDMHPSVEMLRTVGSVCGYSYEYLLSSSGTKISAGQYSYNKLSEEEVLVVRRVLKAYSEQRKNIITIRQVGTAQQMLQTVDYYAHLYKDHAIVVMIDHALLVGKSSPSQSDQHLMDGQIKVWKDMRDYYDALVIPLAQMNSDIEDDRRRLTPNLHFPVKSDIYMGGQFYQGCDFVFMAFMPASIGISQYGPSKLPTTNLLHLSMIKSRHGKTGHAWLYNGLECGKILNAQFEDNPAAGKDTPAQIVTYYPTLCGGILPE